MDRSIADLLVGRTLVGRYRIEEIAGRGGMSVVYRAADERLGREVGVKVISFPSHDPAEQAELRERLRREAASAARIPPHPHVVQVYDYGTDPELGVDFIAMELLRGRDLKGVLRDGPLPLPEALRFLGAAARGVAAGHRAGIIHRDLKPSNIIVVEDGDARTLKILDFGIAKALKSAEEAELTRTGHVPLSPAYASPEQLHGQARLSPASDVYQLGLLGYELLAGERPYGAGEHERMRKGEDLGVPRRGRWLDAPEAVREVIERALSYRPEDRYADAGEFTRALEEAEADRTVLYGETAVSTGSAAAGGARGPALAALRARLPRSRRAWLGVGALVALLAIWLLARSGGDPAVAAGPAGSGEGALDEELRALQAQAYRNLRENASSESGDDAAAAVGEVVEELMRTWVDGDIEAHAALYADRVRFYGRTRRRDQVARWRAETMTVYPAREIELARTAITFPEEGEAEVLVDRSWDFRGDDERWTGAARQELTLRLQEDGEWRVTAERDVEVFREDRDR